MMLRQGAGGGRLGWQPARPRDRHAAALGGHQQQAGDRRVPAGARRARGRARRRAAGHAAAVGGAPGPPGGRRAAAARRRRPCAARRRGLRRAAPGGAVRPHGRRGVPGGARRAARRARRGRHDAAHVGVLEGGGRGPRAPAAHAGRVAGARRPRARQHGAALGRAGAQRHGRVHARAVRQREPGRAQPARRDAAGHAAGPRRRAVAGRQGGGARQGARRARLQEERVPQAGLRQKVPLVVRGERAVPRLLPHGAGAGGRRRLPAEGAAAGGAVRAAALPHQRAAGRRAQEHLPAQRVPGHQAVVLHHVGRVRGARRGRRRHGRLPAVLAGAVVHLPALLALRPRRHPRLAPGQAADHRGAVGARRRGRRRLRAGALLLRVPAAAPAALQALLRVQPLRGQVRPPLPLGRQLHRRRQPPLLCGLPGQPAADVRLDAVGRVARAGGALRRRARHVARVLPVAGVGDAERRVPPILGGGAGRLPAVPGGVPGHDHQRAAEPRALPPLPGARRPLALLARPAPQPGRLPGLRPVRAAGAARARLGRGRPGRRRAALRVTRRPLALLARPAPQPGRLPGLRPVRAAGAARARLGRGRPGRRRAALRVTRRPLALLARPAPQPGRLPGLRPVRAAGAARARLGRGRPGRRRAALRVTRRPLALLARPAPQPGRLPGLRPVRAAGAARARLGRGRPGRRRAALRVTCRING
ncbi:uncharacterized protein FLJ46347 isoform X1 [Maniola hyperantus]|uniref:uncharacterized protein FLJ46347 isoform X1 n=1 Tax=Aphantopus hyperantus TaxID=2795564 RepID=UPI00212D1AD5